MSTKAYTLIIIGAGLLLLIGGFLLGWNVKPAHTCPEITDSVLVKGDTAWIASDTTYIAVWANLPAITDTVNEEIIKSSSIDSIFVHNEDAIRIQAEVEYNLGTDLFDWLMEIDHKDFASHQTDTLKIYTAVMVETEVDNPLWIISTVISIILLGLAIIF